MNRRMRMLLAAVALVVAMPMAPAGAQDGAVEEIEVVSSDATDTGLIELTVAAPGALAGRELPAEAFTVVSDNTERPFSIRRVPDNELDIVLVFDTSNSMAGDPLEAAKDAALSFLRLLPPTAQVAVVSFDFEAEVVAPFTNELDSLVGPIQDLSTDGDTAMYDGVIAAVDLFPIDRTERRTVVLLSDGSDTASTATLQQAARRVRQREADMYAVGLGNQADTEALSRLAGDGQVLTAQDTSALAPVYDDIAALLGNQYVLVFDPLRDGVGEGAVFIDHLGVAGQSSFEYDSRVGAPSSSGQAGEQSTAPTQATPIRTSVVDTTWAGDSALLLGLALLGLALFAGGWLIFSAERRNVSLAVNAPSADKVSGVVGGTTERLTDLTDQLLERKGRGRIVALSLERAGIALRPAEFVLIAVCAGTVAFMVGLLLGSLLLALVLAGVTVMGIRGWLAYKANKRQAQFIDQLPGTIQLLAGSLRAGYALPQAAETVAEEAPSPTGDEFHRLVTEVRLGRDFDEALSALADRVDSDDFNWVVQAISIHRDVGGDLAEVLDNVNSTVRDRNYIRRQYKALSAEGRYSAYLLVSLPFIVFAVLTLMNPEYTDVLYEENRGLLVAATALTSIVIGAIWLRKLVTARF